VRQYSVRSPFVAIIDDEEALCSSLADLMRSMGYRTESFTSAEALLTSPNLALFDGMIADVYMPGMSGLFFVRKLRELGVMTPVILITALPDLQLDNEAKLVGAQGLLRKPFETKALLDCVDRNFSNERPPR
jgi:FixJ family two-component response regulator